MNKQIITLSLVTSIIFVAGLLLWSLEKAESSEITKQELLQKFQTLKTQYKQAKAEGYDVTETKALARQAKQAYNKGDYKKTNELLDKALDALKRARLISKEAIPGAADILTETRNFSNVKVAMLYESIIDTARDRNEVIPIIEEINPGYIHRSFFRWQGLARIEKETDVYGILKTQINAIKERNPYVIIGGAVAAQEISDVEYDPFTDEVVPKEKTWEMALDPQKYGFDLTKEELHEEYWKRTGNKQYILPDITNPEFQELFLDYVRIQIDSGVDAIWIDGFLTQVKVFAKLNNNNPNHPSIEAVFDAADKIINEIHSYGNSKGKYIYVGSWAATKLGSWTAKLDFVTVSPSPEEIRNKKLDDGKWKENIAQIRKRYDSNVPIVVFIDWAFTTDTSLGVFSQTLSKEEQKETLRNFDKFFTENGVLFAYPVHGVT